MKVLFITRKWPPAVGGMETYSYELAFELAKKTELQVLGLAGKADGAPPSLGGLLSFLIKATLKVSFGKRFEVYHAGDLVLWPVLFFARVFKPGSKLVATAHGLDLLYGMREGLLPKVYRSYLKLGIALLSKKLKVISNSNATAELCRQAGFKQVTAVPLATAHQAKAVEAAKTEPFVLFVGRLVKRKGAAWFAENVLPQLPEHISFKVAGPKWDADEEKALSNRNRVEYLGIVASDELTRLRQSAIAVVMPNISMGVKDFEGFGLTAPEAAAEGGVLIASAVEGVTDAVIDGETGFLMPAESPKAWVAKITEIEKWPVAKRAEFVKQAQLSVKTNYSWQRVAENTMAVYHS